ncbi:MAG: GatB/YqeY domain-containing protein [Lachnospiraceae bacterium]|nr:GatB/YqeY domain-containing protein [Lachnospiraceae bacterium]
MSKIDVVRGEMMAAMKAKDKERKNVLSSLLTALKNAQIDKREELTEAEEDQVVLKLIKQSKETLEMTPADRQDIIDECNYTIKVLEEYAPEMMDENKIKEVIDGVLKELSIDKPSASDKGKIMKVLMPKVKGKADGGLVNKILSGMLE